MASFTGASLVLSTSFNDAPGLLVTSQLEQHTLPFSIAPRAGKLVTAAASVATSTTSMGAREVLGASEPVRPTALMGSTPGDFRFDRIHVTLESAAYGVPNRRALGTLLSTVPIEVEVWSAYRLLSQVLNNITVAGPAGVTATTTDSLPLAFPPLRSRFYTVTVGIVGGPSIDNTVHWDFDGISEPLAELSGTRLVPMPFEPDWSAGLDETYEWLTNVITANNGNEQRVKLRTRPRRIFEFTPKTFTVQEAAYLESLIFGWINQKFGVPAWTERMRVTATASAGQNLITVSSTDDRDMVNGQTVLVWRDPFTWEARVVTSFTGTVITLDDVLSQTWTPGNTFVLPIWNGSLDAQQQLARPSRDAGETRLSFLLEPRVL